MVPATDPLLAIEDLRVRFSTEVGDVFAVNGVSLELQPGRVLGIVGESGSGKSVTGLTVMGLLSRNAATSGRVRLMGRDLLGLPEAELRKLRGATMGMVFQDPMTSLNPFHPVGWQLREAIQLHSAATRKEADQHACELLEAVEIPEARKRLRSYPHEFSGGSRQRVMIAMAMANEPALLIADEPTTALDVTTQVQIFTVMGRLTREVGTGVLLITHDLGVVAETCHDVLVMYGGRVAEYGPVERVFAHPTHPYTWGLISSLPSRAKDGLLTTIPGSPPSALQTHRGCPFASRCEHAMPICRADPPPALKVTMNDPTHLDACHLSRAAKEAGIEDLRAGVA